MERVITMGVQTAEETLAEATATMDELEELVSTAGGEVVESHLQKRQRPDAATFIGKGKVEELRGRLLACNAQTVVFNDELKPGQQRSLEELLGAKVVDRTRLILDIFAQRARTREGILQVELAQLTYMLPRMTARFGRFEQQTGGIGTRGPGERKLEVDRRRIRDRIALLNRHIGKIRHERTGQRAVRSGIPMPQVALIGYTNAGKSSLLNALLQQSTEHNETAHQVYADDKLFATLDPTTRRIRLGAQHAAAPGAAGRIVLFTDTVGFIRKLPTELVAAFRATLEEVNAAALLVHVIDASDPDWAEQERAVVAILKDLKTSGLSRLTVFNKMDRLTPTQRAAFSAREGILISARTGEGLESLLAAVEDRLAVDWVNADIRLAHHEGARLKEIYDTMDVLKQESTAEGFRLQVRAHPSTLARFQGHDAR